MGSVLCEKQISENKCDRKRHCSKKYQICVNKSHLCDDDFQANSVSIRIKKSKRVKLSGNNQILNWQEIVGLE